MFDCAHYKLTTCEKGQMCYITKLEHLHILKAFEFLPLHFIQLFTVGLLTVLDCCLHACPVAASLYPGLSYHLHLYFGLHYTTAAKCTGAYTVQNRKRFKQSELIHLLTGVVFSPAGLSPPSSSQGRG